MQQNSSQTSPSDTNVPSHEDEKATHDIKTRVADEQTRQRLSRFLLRRIKLLSAITIGVVVLVFFVFPIGNRIGKFTLSPASLTPLAVDLFDSVKQDIGVFSEDTSFFDEQERDIEEINTAYEDK